MKPHTRPSRRNRRMVTLADMTRRFTEEHAQPEYRKSLLAGLPASLFGRTVASQITEVNLDGTTLVLKIPDDTWRKELRKNKIMLMIKAREIQPDIRDLSLVP